MIVFFVVVVVVVVNGEGSDANYQFDMKVLNSS